MEEMEVLAPHKIVDRAVEDGPNSINSKKRVLKLNNKYIFI